MGSGTQREVSINAGVLARIKVGGWRREWEFIIEDSSAESAFPQTSLCSLAHHNISNIRQFKNKHEQKQNKDKHKDKDKEEDKEEDKRSPRRQLELVAATQLSGLFISKIKLIHRNVVPVTGDTARDLKAITVLIQPRSDNWRQTYGFRSSCHTGATA
jgi:hypothetical protein